jgi:hypothetical protein
LDLISSKIDELGLRMTQFSQAALYRPLEHPDSIPQHERGPMSSFASTTASPLRISAPRSLPPPQKSADERRYNVRHEFAQAEHEGESSLFSQAIYAVRFLQNAIENMEDEDAARDMGAVIDNLKAAAYNGNPPKHSLERLYPHAHTLTPGSNTSSLTLPPVEKIFACLRLAKESAQVATLWLGSYMTPAQFQDYFIGVASPDPSTNSDLIIVHCGLYWLFGECAKAVPDAETKKDYSRQALVCEANLETVLANLPFHQPSNIDLAYAMGMAALYCLQKSKPFSAWNFISSASHTIQALGLHCKSPLSSQNSDRDAIIGLFWTVYMAEKMLSLRLGRSSTLRDQDITLSPPFPQRSDDSFLVHLTPGWVRLARIQGRIYDEIYTSEATKQSLDIRTSRALALVAELNATMKQTEDTHNRYQADKGHILGHDYHEIAKHSDRVIGLSMLTLVYRSISPETHSKSSFRQECIDAARKTLQEHQKCVVLITHEQEKMIFLETYMNWTITYTPFIPFIVLFCHTIETFKASDLQHMETLVKSFQSTSDSHGHSICEKQYRLFKALYDVASRYVEVRSKMAEGVPHQGSWQTTQEFSNDANTITMDYGLVTPSVASPDHISGSNVVGDTGISLANSYTRSTALQKTVLEEVDLEMELSGGELWDWFNKNQSLMTMFEDS